MLLPKTTLNFLTRCAICFLSGILPACSGPEQPRGPKGEFTPSHTPKDCVMQTRGEGEFVYTRYSPLADKPVNVHYYLPKQGDIKGMPILFAMHGAEREGLNQINAWKSLAESNGFIVIAPEFTKENGYQENDYQFGGVFADRTFASLRPEEEWTYRLIEKLFDYVKNETDNDSERYSLFGHSAGGQFVHRFMYAMPQARVNRAVAANPGSWTFPLPDGLEGTDGNVYGWPYSLKGVPFSKESDLRRFYSSRLYVQTGTADTETDSYLPVDPPSMAQGPNRHERAKNFYEACVKGSRESGVTLNIRLEKVEGAGHSTSQMASSAYKLLFN